MKMRMPSEKTSAKLLDSAVLAVGEEPNPWYGSHPHTTLLQVLRTLLGFFTTLKKSRDKFDNTKQISCVYTRYS